MSAARQVGALLALRWQMLRSGTAKAGALAVLAVVLWLLTWAGDARQYADDALVSTVLAVAPGVFLGFGVLAVVAPLTAGGGHELVPQDQLVAYPVRPSTLFLGGLLLAPANLVWAVQLLALVAVTSLLTLGGGLALAMLTTALFVLAATLVGQAVAWLVAGTRQSRRGRQALVAGGTALAVGTPLALRAGAGEALLNAGPGFQVVLAVIAGGGRRVAEWAPTAAATAAAGLLAGLIGLRACAWALRRPTDVRVRETRPVRRRGGTPGQLRTLLAVDRASAWRAPALRRGGLVILLLPPALVATLRVPWESLVVMPGLVAAGAGLLFGVNAFALDSSGAVWLHSLPANPAMYLLSKTLVVAETVAMAVALSAVVGALRSANEPTSAQVAAMVGAGLACTALVVALCVRASVRRPTRAELSGPRDAVAPPGALALASVRLALPCAGAAMLIAVSAQSRDAWLPVLVAAPFVLLAALSLLRSARYYADPFRRARIVQAVASG